MRRFFVPPSNIENNQASISGSDVHHITSVLRMKTGDKISVTDGVGNLYEAEITEIKQDEIILILDNREKIEDHKIIVRLYQAIPKGTKFDWIVEKASELGVQELIPVISERTIPRLSEERGLKKIARWERLAFESAKQVGRVSSMKIQKAIPFKEIEHHLNPFSLKIVPWELEDTRSLKSILKSVRETKEIELLIGPEGGLSHDEIKALTGVGFICASLGSQILKAETAAITAIGNIYYELETE